MHQIAMYKLKGVSDEPTEVSHDSTEPRLKSQFNSTNCDFQKPRAANLIITYIV